MPISLEKRPPLMQSRTREMYYACKEAMKRANLTYKSNEKCAQVAREELTKQADFGANQNPAFEKAFGSIAFTYLQEKAPGLLPHIVGFQLLDRDEGGRKAVGVFVAKIGERIIDVPMFFINGELKGHQVMRIRQPELFIPLREAFLDYLLSRLPQDLGENGPMLSEPSPLRSTPEMSPFNASRLLKGAADLAHIEDWALDLDVPQSYAAMRGDRRNLELGLSLLGKQASVQLVDLMPMLSTNESYLKTAAALADRYVYFRQGMEKRYGSDWLKTAAEQFVSMRKRASQLRSPQEYSLKLQSGINSRADELEFRAHPLEKQSSLSLAQELDLGEIQQFGSVAIDRRPSDKLAVAYKVESSCYKLEPPESPGLYDVFQSDGKKIKAVVIPANYRKPHAQHDLVIDLKTQRIAMAQRNSYICRTEPNQHVKKFDVNEILKTKQRRPKAGELFVLVDSSGMVTGPFLCREKVDRSLYMVKDVRTHSALEVKDNDNIPDGSITPFDSSDSVDELIYDEQLDSATVTKHRGHIYAGKKVRIAVIQSKMNPLFEEDFEEGYVPYKYFKDMRLDLMYPSSTGFAELSKFSNLKVQKRAAEQVEVNGKRMSKEEARKLLMVSMSLGKEAAHEVLDGSEDVKRYMVFPAGVQPTFENMKKLAFPVPNTPSFPAEEQPYNSESGRYMVQEPQSEETQSAPMERREPLRPWQDPHDGMFENEGGGPQMDVPAGPNPDELFDVVGLISLVRNSRIDSNIRQATKSLMQTIDQLGRLVFMLYAHYDEFETRYGDDDIQDLESALISVFEGAGDLFITLTRRSNDPEPEMDILDLPVSM